MMVTSIMTTIMVNDDDNHDGDDDTDDDQKENRAKKRSKTMDILNNEQWTRKTDEGWEEKKKTKTKNEDVNNG